jgi:hypothetical protein
MQERICEEINRVYASLNLYTENRLSQVVKDVYSFIYCREVKGVSLFQTHGKMLLEPKIAVCQPLSLSLGNHPNLNERTSKSK